jgi:DNA-binding MarR family transcriptional regulator
MQLIDLRVAQGTDMIDEILEIKKRCNFSDEIGKEHGLTPNEVECISAIASHTAISSKHLSSIMDLSPSRGSRIVNRLIDRNFVSATADIHDRRYLSLSLTKKGEGCYVDIQREKQLCAQRLLASLDADQIHAVENGLKILLKVM